MFISEVDIGAGTAWRFQSIAQGYLHIRSHFQSSADTFHLSDSRPSMCTKLLGQKHQAKQCKENPPLGPCG
jgi:hypothetical protein